MAWQDAFYGASPSSPRLYSLLTKTAGKPIRHVLLKPREHVWVNESAAIDFERAKARNDDSSAIAIITIIITGELSFVLRSG